jgi:Rab-GTPase-TBC domain
MPNTIDGENEDRGTTGQLDPETLRSRKREKQLRYQRHKARLGREATPSAAGSVDQTVDPSSDDALTHPPATPRSKALSSPYIQSRLSTPPKPQEKAESLQTKATNFPPTNFPKRQQAGSRKSGLVQQMRAKQLSVAIAAYPAEAVEEQIDDLEYETEMQEHEDTVCQETNREDDNAPVTSGEDPADDALRPSSSSHDSQKTNNGAFDMRSIVDYHSSPVTWPNAPNKADNVAIVDPMDEDLVERLRRIEESHQEEKKEKDGESQPLPDATWDVSNPVFEQHFATARNSTKAGNGPNTAGALDMFATASWEEADGDATFSDIEAHFLRIMDGTYSHDVTTVLPNEHKQILEDVKRNLELASVIDSVYSELVYDLTAFDQRQEEESQLFDGSTADLQVQNVDEESLVGMFSCSEDTESIRAIPPSAREKDKPLVNEDVPLLSGGSSSDGGDLESEAGLSVQERINAYNAPKERDDESSCEVDVDEAYPSDIENDHSEYFSQMNDDEDLTVDVLNPLDDIRAMYLVNNAPTFGPAAARAIQTAQFPIESQYNVSATTDAASDNLVTSMLDPLAGRGSAASSLTAEQTAGSYGKNDYMVTANTNTSTGPSSMFSLGVQQRLAALGLPPPPPPPGAKNNKKRRKNSSKTGKQIPLLAPPPEEKLKKWEETRGKHSLVSLQVNSQRSEPLQTSSEEIFDDKFLLAWLSREVLKDPDLHIDGDSNAASVIRLSLDDDERFNRLCHFMAETVNHATVALGDDASFDEVTLNTNFSDDDTVTTADYSVRSHRSSRSRKALEKQRPLLKPMVLSEASKKLPSSLLAANFVSFIYLTSKVSKIPSPFGSVNPFLVDIVNSSLRLSKLEKDSDSSSTPQKLIFDHPQGEVTTILRFAYHVCKKSFDDVRQAQPYMKSLEPLKLDTTEAIQEEPEDHIADAVPSPQPTPITDTSTGVKSLRYMVPFGHPSPFEAAVWEAPRIVPAMLSFLGDPVVVCRMKLINRYCNRLVAENEHTIIQDAVRAGGINMNVRPAFWMWISLQKCSPEESSMAKGINSTEDLKRLEQDGREGKWQHVIERDVERSFGNMPPHKMGARLRTDSIVKALVTWGQSRVMKRGVKGGGEETPLPELGQVKKGNKTVRPRKAVSLPPWECGQDHQVDDSDSSGAPADTVSDWGPISPVASMTESSYVGSPEEVTGEHNSIPKEELALCGSYLTHDMKQDLQRKLRFILHSLAAAHGDVGYCQGMDYVVAHLLRILQDTIRWNAVQNTLPNCLVTALDLPDFSGRRGEPLANLYQEVDSCLVVEEAIFRIMDAFFTSYNLRHMYWPELRCLKTCCRVFERLIQIKLPVLADHFEHHELNVGLFALGWFQTLFLYLPGMPSETANRMIDIWLVERSFKIFFRVGTAILFLSQPILLNHELEGMMTYLNTIPDATLLKPDILIPCALNIKVTNRMLQELETEVTAQSS